MFEYVAFNPFNSSPEALAAELTKKSAEGWEVVDIVTTFDGRYCAFLRRPRAIINGASRGVDTNHNHRNHITSVSNTRRVVRRPIEPLRASLLGWP